MWLAPAAVTVGLALLVPAAAHAVGSSTRAGSGGAGSSSSSTTSSPTSDPTSSATQTPTPDPTPTPTPTPTGYQIEATIDGSRKINVGKQATINFVVTGSRRTGPTEFTAKIKDPNGKAVTDFTLTKDHLTGQLTFIVGLEGTYRVVVKATHLTQSASVEKQVIGLGIFSSSVRAATVADTPYSYRKGCPVPRRDLRVLNVTYWNYSGLARTGDLVVASWAVDSMKAVFRDSFRNKFLIKKIVPIDAYYDGGANSPTEADILSQEDGNTSAFNCRQVVGNPYRLSRHSYGDAIDINTYENPYGTAGGIYPQAAAKKYYYNRDAHLHDHGVITSSSSIAQALWGQGWQWGARWTYPDYQHWSATGQ